MGNDYGVIRVSIDGDMVGFNVHDGIHHGGRTVRVPAGDVRSFVDVDGVDANDGGVSLSVSDNDPNHPYRVTITGSDGGAITGYGHAEDIANMKALLRSMLEDNIPNGGVCLCR